METHDVVIWWIMGVLTTCLILIVWVWWHWVRTETLEQRGPKKGRGGGVAMRECETRVHFYQEHQMPDDWRWTAFLNEPNAGLTVSEVHSRVVGRASEGYREREDCVRGALLTLGVLCRDVTNLLGGNGGQTSVYRMEGGRWG